MGAGMTEEEKKTIEESIEKQIKSVKEFIKLLFQNLEQRLKNQQADISLTTAMATENKMKIIVIEGRVNTMEEVKKAVEDTTGKGWKKWQIVAGVITLIALLTFNILNLIF